MLHSPPPSDLDIMVPPLIQPQVNTWSNETVPWSPLVDQSHWSSAGSLRRRVFGSLYYPRSLSRDARNFAWQNSFPLRYTLSPNDDCHMWIVHTCHNFFLYPMPVGMQYFSVGASLQIQLPAIKFWIITKWQMQCDTTICDANSEKKHTPVINDFLFLQQWLKGMYHQLTRSHFVVVYICYLEVGNCGGFGKFGFK